MNNAVAHHTGGGLAIREGRKPTSNNALSAGIGVSYGVLSIQGKLFRIKQGKEETKLLDKRGNPVPELNVVIVDASPHVSRTYYAGGFEANAGKPPTCSSADGKTPDAFVENPPARSCAGCPHSVRDQVTPSGAKVSACSNNRRVAVVPEGDLANESLGGPMLLRVPGGSLIGLSNYAGSLDRKGYDFFEVVTTLQFDTTAHPKLLFHADRALEDDEQEIIDAMRSSEATRAVLALSEHAEQAAAAPAAEPVKSGVDALPPRERRREPVSQNAQNIQYAQKIEVETPAPVQKRTRAPKSNIADAVQQPVVVTAAANSFDSDLDARLQGLL